MVTINVPKYRIRSVILLHLINLKLIQVVIAALCPRNVVTMFPSKCKCKNATMCLSKIATTFQFRVLLLFQCRNVVLYQEDTANQFL